jgi:hypothetical protein
MRSERMDLVASGLGRKKKRSQLGLLEKVGYEILWIYGYIMDITYGFMDILWI